MNAVSEGMTLAQSSPETMKQLCHLKQQLWMEEPGLYPLRCASRDAARGNTKRAEKYIELCVCYTPETFGSFSTATWAERLEIMKPTNSVIVTSELSSNTVSSASLFGDSFLDMPPSHVKMEYRLANPENFVNNQEMFDHPSTRRFRVPVWLHCFGAQ